jgi:ribosome biogenesis GTPase A
MPKKFKRGAAKRQRAASGKASRRERERAGRKARRPNAKVPGGRRKKKRDRNEAGPATATPQAHGPRETEQGKRFTRRQRTAAELGISPRANSSQRLPVVAIVGRPNVGKSSLFNKLAGSRISIEDPRPGTTRDRISTQVRLRDAEDKLRIVELFDTAGIGIVDEQRVGEHVHEQINNAVASADVVAWLGWARAPASGNLA